MRNRVLSLEFEVQLHAYACQNGTNAEASIIYCFGKEFHEI